MLRLRLRSLGALLMLASVALWLPPAGAPHARAGGGVSLKLLAINDLHGGLDLGRQVQNRPVGGAAYLAAHLKRRAAGHPNVMVVGAGDMVGASPPISRHRAAAA